MFLTATQQMDDVFTEAITSLLKALSALLGLAIATGFIWILIVAALVTWVVKKVWYAGSKKNKPKYRRYEENEDWLTRSQRRQEIRFENASPPKAPNAIKSRNIQKKEQMHWYTSDDVGKAWYPRMDAKSGNRSLGTPGLYEVNPKSKLCCFQDQEEILPPWTIRFQVPAMRERFILPQYIKTSIKSG